MNIYNYIRKCIDIYLEKAKTENKHRDMSRIPTVKIELVGTKACWLVTESDPQSEELYYGLCDLGLGYPEIGAFSLRDIYNVAEVKGWAIAVKPIYELRDLEYYLSRSKHACVTSPVIH